MRILKRKMTNKRKSVKSFQRHSKRTKAANMQKAPQRGGWRL
jgi:hypothetical protein